MYRGSSFLLQKDYKVHAAAIRELMKEKYLCLWAIKCKKYLIEKDSLKLLFELSNALEKIYHFIRISANLSIKREIPSNAVSEVLITKILMGTLGCVPAYDRYYNAGVRRYGVASGIFNPKSISELSRFYVENEMFFEDWRESISQGGIEYPQMKILDMCFWQTGYNLDKGATTHD